MTGDRPATGSRQAATEKGGLWPSAWPSVYVVCDCCVVVCVWCVRLIQSVLGRLGAVTVRQQRAAGWQRAVASLMTGSRQQAKADSSQQA